MTINGVITNLYKLELAYNNPIQTFRPFYDVHISRIKCVHQKKFVRYSLRGLEWMNMYDLPPYVDRCTLFRLDMMTKRRSSAFVMFIFDVLSGWVISPNMLSLVSAIALCYQFFTDCFSLHYIHEALNHAFRHINDAVRLINQFVKRFELLMLALYIRADRTFWETLFRVFKKRFCSQQFEIFLNLV
jgi:hypothetical protein